MTRVLVVDDDTQPIRALRINLRASQYDVDLAADGATALTLAGRFPPDLVILDLGLPDMDGIEVIHALRGRSTAPILALSVRDAQAAKVTALDAGADDYITMPFSMEEVLARIRSVLRRTGPVDTTGIFSTNAFTVDLAAKRLTTDAGAVRLTPTEWHLLEILIRNHGQLVSQRQLFCEVRGPSYETQTSYLRFYVAQLRRKLEPDPTIPRYFLTEPGRGYRFQP